MRLSLIEFGVPGPISGVTYTYDETEAPSVVELKIVDNRNTTHVYRANDLVDVTIGSCTLEKDDIGVWITGIDSLITITGDLLAKSDGRYWLGAMGRVDNNYVKDATVKFAYLSVEEDITALVRDLKLNEIGI